jgi:surface protein
MDEIKKHLSSKVSYATLEDLKLDLSNTILPQEVYNIILKYTETIIKVEFNENNNNEIAYYSQSEFDGLYYENVLNIAIYGVLVMKNPINKFKDIYIKTIRGPVVITGDASFMFSKAIRFNSDISKWDTSNVTDMSGMFFRAENFNSDISKWDTSNVTDMSGMFDNAILFNSDLSNWNTKNVTNMSGMFSNAESFNSDLSNWNTKNVLDTNRMFLNAINFNSDLSNWDMSNVTRHYNMFYGATKFTGIIKEVKIWKIIYE